jgi:hypothetical protein
MEQLTGAYFQSENNAGHNELTPLHQEPTYPGSIPPILTSYSSFRQPFDAHAQQQPSSQTHPNGPGQASDVRMMPFPLLEQQAMVDSQNRGYYLGEDFMGSRLDQS